MARGVADVEWSATRGARPSASQATWSGAREAQQGLDGGFQPSAHAPSASARVVSAMSPSTIAQFGRIVTLADVVTPAPDHPAVTCGNDWSTLPTPLAPI